MQATALSKIEETLATMRPYIQTHGGDIELVSFEEGIVSVRLKGACVSCPISMITLKMGIEERLKEEIQEVVSVVNVDS